MIFCKQCKENKPTSEFLWNGRRGRTRVTKCNGCASDNMAKYWRTRMVGRKPDEFSDAGD